MKKIILIVAGGRGVRMKSAIPKQFLMLDQTPVLMHTIRRFKSFDTNSDIRLVLPSDEIPFWEELCERHRFSINHKIYKGGETRFHSVKNGLVNIKEGALVSIHDGVRPLVSLQTIKNCFDLAEKYGTAVPVVKLAESIRKVSQTDSVAENRDNFRMVQTPQVFQSDILLDAYGTEYQSSFTDDASVVENSGYKIYLAEGNVENIKITSPKDLDIARLLIRQESD